MKKRFRLIRRNIRGGKFYCVDNLTGKRTSLQTANPDEAEEIIAAKNQSLRQPLLNLHIAKAYLAGSDSGIATRTWRQAVDAIIETKHGANKHRWLTVTKDPAMSMIWDLIIVETQADFLLRVLRGGTVSTNVFLRRIHNYCLDMNWLPWPIIPKRQWPAVRHKDKRAITLAEHMAIAAVEKNTERKVFYQLCWYLGGSQSDIAGLRAEDVDYENRTIAYVRKKTGSVARIQFAEDLEDILSKLPKEGPIFPWLIKVREADRATEFRQRCKALGIHGITLHSYRYAWAERAKKAGYPERFAQEALGHNSKAIHRAYAKHAEVILPALESYEQKRRDGKLIPFPKSKRQSGN